MIIIYIYIYISTYCIKYLMHGKKKKKSLLTIINSSIVDFIQICLCSFVFLPLIFFCFFLFHFFFFATYFSYRSSFLFFSLFSFFSFSFFFNFFLYYIGPTCALSKKVSILFPSSYEKIHGSFNVRDKMRILVLCTSAEWRLK